MDNQMNKSLKRSRSTESIEQALKRVKPFEAEPNHTLYPAMKPISISTRTHNGYYENVNGFLSSVHKERFGDPEIRESWWKEEQDIEMEDTNNEYENVNSILKQAFLTRRQQNHK